jgi:His/Glu/Gln/Arg/opine family amino acid ABC transporter permease subunit
MFFDASLSWSDIVYLLQGALVTIAITAASVAIGTVLGVLFGLIRAGAPWWIGAPIGGLLDIFRSVPLLIQLVLFNSFNSMFRLHWPSYTVACLCLGINAAAFCTEIVRSGVSAVPTTTRRAARSLGLTWGQGDLDHLADGDQDRVSKLDRSGTWRDEGHVAGSVDRHH